MSEIVNYKGKIRLIEKLKNETLENQAKRILRNCELKSYNNTYLEQLEDEFYQSIVRIDEYLYEVIEIKEHEEYEDIFELIKNNDNTYNFHIKYYNGGCSFNEAIETSFETYRKLNK